MRNWFESMAFAVAFLPCAPGLRAGCLIHHGAIDIQQTWDQANYQSANAGDKQRQLEALSARSEDSLASIRGARSLSCGKASC